MKSDIFNEYYTKYITHTPTIFDVGAYNGRSITRFRGLFKEVNLHLFEPITENVNVIKEHFGDSAKINNTAVGNRNGRILFLQNAKPDTSSLFEVNDTQWLKTRAQEYNVPVSNFTKSQIVDIIKLDDYASNNNITSIDILKIDVQGSEIGVLKGAYDIISNRTIKFFEIEVNLHGIFDMKDKDVRDIENLIVPYGYKMVAISNAFNLIANRLIIFDCLFVRDDIYSNIIGKL